MEDKQNEPSIIPDSENVVLPARKLGDVYDKKGKRVPVNAEDESGEEVDKKV